MYPGFLIPPVVLANLLIAVLIVWSIGIFEWFNPVDEMK